MAKLYFRYGTMGSAKSLNLLAVAHNYRQQGKQVLLIKPSADQRQLEHQASSATIGSRAGLSAEVDILLGPNTHISSSQLENLDCILVDESQFLTTANVEQLREISSLHGIPVICYGLRTDFRSILFEGSRRLLELADTIEEVKTTCNQCNRKATMNLRLIDNQATIEGPSLLLGAEEHYTQVCYRCYRDALDRSQAQKLERGTASPQVQQQRPSEIIN